MKKIVSISALVLVFGAVSAQAQSNCQYIGNQRITNYSNGTGATTQKIGNQTITTFSDGRTVTCKNIGNQRICN